MGSTTIIIATVITIGLAGCEDRVPAGAPVGGAIDTDAALQRFFRRAHLDLTARAPTEDQLAEATVRLRAAGNTPSARLALIDELVAQPAFAAAWIGELENGIYGGSSLDQHYGLVCALVRGGDPACQSCTALDACSCVCPAITPLEAERAQLRTTAAELLAGARSAVLERRYAIARGYYALSPAPEGRITALFDDFLARPPEPDELENGRSLVIFGDDGFLGAPVGYMFHRHGKNYSDLLDIIFESEVYREALVRRVFERYLARTPTTPELLQFGSMLEAYDANDAAIPPDVRPLLRAVVASREYFDQ